MAAVDVSDLVQLGDPDGELVPVQACACGFRPPYWGFYLSVYSDKPTACGACGRRFYVSIGVRVYEVVADT
jgi:hypothetical protein